MNQILEERGIHIGDTVAWREWKKGRGKVRQGELVAVNGAMATVRMGIREVAVPVGSLRAFVRE